MLAVLSSRYKKVLVGNRDRHGTLLDSDIVDHGALAKYCRRYMVQEGVVVRSHEVHLEVSLDVQDPWDASLVLLTWRVAIV